eukprot:scaffold178690_cov53-Attheya_sp.AAC.2
MTVLAYVIRDHNKPVSNQQTLFQAFKVTKSTKRSAADASIISTSLTEHPMSQQKTISFPSQESQDLSNSTSFLAAATSPMLALLTISVQLNEKKCQGLLTLKPFKETNAWDLCIPMHVPSMM